MLDHKISSKTIFQCLPEEIIQKILLYCDPDDISLNLQRVCQRLQRLSNEPFLWRHNCQLEFRYWDIKHCIQDKYLCPVGDVDWKSLYRYRKKVDLKTTQLLNSIICTQKSRISKYEAIAEFGYDAKDTLLRHIGVDENTEDVLARRYYANSVLDYLHRANAIEIWQKTLENKSVPVETALGCFDLFILHNKRGDVSEINEIFDKMAECFRSQFPGVEDLSTRAKAFATIDFMSRCNFTSLESNRVYQNIESNYIGLYLQDPKDPPSPLLSAVIYCALGRRIGLDARGCGTPNYIHIVVFSRPGETLDAAILKEEECAGEPMYLDPQRSMIQVPLHTLRKTLSDRGLHPGYHAQFLSDVSIASVILRMSKTILATVRRFRSHENDFYTDTHSVIRNPSSHFMDMENAHYSALWADFLFTGHSRQLTSGTSQSNLIPIILERYERQYPMDSRLIENYILPLYNDPRSLLSCQIMHALRAVRISDESSKQIRLRLPPADKKVLYKVGQVFRHKRYYYQAVIFGWDLEGGVNFDRTISNDADSLSSERHQTFYHALVEDTSTRYVAEENIDIIKPDFPNNLMNQAGKYFKRWDSQSHTFVSGIRDEYPED